MITQGLFSSNTNEWATPRAVFDALDAEFHFNLDPCSTHENAKCEKHYTIEDDGLTKNWGGGECSAIPHMEGSYRNGCGSVSRKQRSRTPWWLCSYPPGRTPHIFTITFTIGRGKFVSFVAVYISMSREMPRRFRA